MPANILTIVQNADDGYTKNLYSIVNSMAVQRGDDGNLIGCSYSLVLEVVFRPTRYKQLSMYQCNSRPVLHPIAERCS